MRGRMCFETVRHRPYHPVRFFEQFSVVLHLNVKLQISIIPKKKKIVLSIDIEDIFDDMKPFTSSFK